MDSSITAAGRALRAGDPLGALKRVALRDDPAALALRGIAMAQLEDLGRARELLRRAARGFGPRETLARARCLTAEAEVALAARDLAWPPRALTEALRTFTARGDRENAAHARLLQIRRLLLLGRVDEADGACATLELGAGPARLAAVAALVTFEIALRRGRAEQARAALARAREAAARSAIGALCAASGGRSPRSGPPLVASAWWREGRARYCCWRRRSRAPTPPSWRCSQTARPGRPRRWLWPWGPASGRCSGPWSPSRRPARCAPWAAAAPSAGSPRRWPDSRRPCCSRSPTDSGKERE